MKWSQQKRLQEKGPTGPIQPLKDEKLYQFAISPTKELPGKTWDEEKGGSCRWQSLVMFDHGPKCELREQWTR